MDMFFVNLNSGLIGVPSIGRYALKSTVAKIGETVPITIKLKMADAKRNLLVTTAFLLQDSNKS